MIVVAVVIMAMVVMNIRCMGIRRMGSAAMGVVMMLDGVAARIARMRPEYRDQAGQNGAQQRQKDDCLNHSCA